MINSSLFLITYYSYNKIKIKYKIINGIADNERQYINSDQQAASDNAGAQLEEDIGRTC